MPINVCVNNLFASHMFKMRFEKQQCNVKVQNFEGEQRTTSKHGMLFPNNIRCIISGPSNSGKTNLMISLLTSINGLRYETVYLYSKSLYQTKYQILNNILTSISGIKYFPCAENVNLTPLSEVLPNSIFIFDDIATDRQEHLRSYFCQGRHKQIDSFCLIQTYARVCKHLVRDNANLLILFKQDDLNLKHVYNDHVNTDMSFNDFKNFCSNCWKKNFGFVVINKECDLFEGRYRKGFNQFLKSI